jgi:hypothetical protein
VVAVEPEAVSECVAGVALEREEQGSISITTKLVASCVDRGIGFEAMFTAAGSLKLTTV